MVQEGLAHLLNLEHVNRHGRVCQFQAVNVVHLMFLEFGYACVYASDERLLLFGNASLVEVDKCLVVVVFEIVVAAIVVPVGLVVEELVDVVFHKPNASEGIRVVAQYSELHHRHVADVHIKVDLVGQKTVGNEERMRVVIYVYSADGVVGNVLLLACA